MWTTDRMLKHILTQPTLSHAWLADRLSKYSFTASQERRIARRLHNLRVRGSISMEAYEQMAKLLNAQKGGENG